MPLLRKDNCRSARIFTDVQRFSVQISQDIETLPKLLKQLSNITEIDSHAEILSLLSISDVVNRNLSTFQKISLIFQVEITFLAFLLKTKLLFQSVKN